MPSPFPTPTGKRAVAYFTSWSVWQQRQGFYARDLFAGLTDLAYAFWGVTASGTVYSLDPFVDYQARYIRDYAGVEPLDTFFGPGSTDPYYGLFNQLRKLQAQGRPLNVQLSIGGPDANINYSDAVLTSTTRSAFAASLVTALQTYPIFSGVNLNWEFFSDDGVNYGAPANVARVGDAERFVLFLEELRTQLTSAGMGDYTISTTFSANPAHAQFDVAAVAGAVDQVHCMTYDFYSGAWYGPGPTLHHTNPRPSAVGAFSAQESADFYLSAGCPAAKLFIGAAGYSRGFTDTDGINQPANGDSTDQPWIPGFGIALYEQLPLSGAVEVIDPETKGAYSYDPVSRNWNGYDNPESVREKIRIIDERDLGGIIFWESQGDDRRYTDRSLVRTAYESLTHGTLSTRRIPAFGAFSLADVARAKGYDQTMPLTISPWATTTPRALTDDGLSLVDCCTRNHRITPPGMLVRPYRLERFRQYTNEPLRLAHLRIDTRRVAGTVRILPEGHDPAAYTMVQLVERQQSGGRRWTLPATTPGPTDALHADEVLRDSWFVNPGASPAITTTALALGGVYRAYAGCYWQNTAGPYAGTGFLPLAWRGTPYLVVSRFGIAPEVLSASLYRLGMSTRFVDAFPPTLYTGWPTAAEVAQVDGVVFPRAWFLPIPLEAPTAEFADGVAVVATSAAVDTATWFPLWDATDTLRGACRFNAGSPGAQTLAEVVTL